MATWLGEQTFSGWVDAKISLGYNTVSRNGTSVSFTYGARIAMNGDTWTTNGWTFRLAYNGTQYWAKASQVQSSKGVWYYANSTSESTTTWEAIPWTYNGTVPIGTNSVTISVWVGDNLYTPTNSIGPFNFTVPIPAVGSPSGSISSSGIGRTTATVTLNASSWGNYSSAHSSAPYNIEYGTTTSYGTSRSSTSPSWDISGLSANTTYYYRGRLRNSADLYSSYYTGSFTTIGNDPTITSISPTISRNTCTLTPTVVYDTNAIFKSYSVQYGKTTSYGSTSAYPTLTGLDPNTKYYYSMTVTDNYNRTSTPLTGSFTTIGNAPTITSTSVSNITVTSARIDFAATYDTNATFAMASLQYGKTTSYGNTVGGFDPTSINVSNLEPNTLYYYSLVVSDNYSRASTSQTGSFTTSQIPTPTSNEVGIVLTVDETTRTFTMAVNGNIPSLYRCYYTVSLIDENDVNYVTYNDFMPSGTFYQEYNYNYSVSTRYLAYIRCYYALTSNVSFVGQTASFYSDIINVNVGPQLFIKAGSVNLFDKDNPNIINGYANSANKVKILASDNAKSVYIPCEPNKTYTINKIKSSRFYVYTTTDLPAINVAVMSMQGSDTSTSQVVKTPSTASYLCIYFYNSSYDTTLTMEEILDTIYIDDNSGMQRYDLKENDLVTRPRMAIKSGGVTKYVGLKAGGAKTLIVKQGMATPRTDTTFWNSYSSSYLSAQSEGWVKCTIETPRSAQVYVNHFLQKTALHNLKPDTIYTVYFEFKDCTLDGATCIFHTGETSSNSQFTTDPSRTSTQIKELIAKSANGVGVYKALIKTKPESTFNAATMSMRDFITCPINSVGSLTFRKMLLEGDYTNIDVSYNDYIEEPVSMIKSGDSVYSITNDAIDPPTSDGLIAYWDGVQNTTSYYVQKNLFDQETMIVKGKAMSNGNEPTTYGSCFISTYIAVEANTTYTLSGLPNNNDGFGSATSSGIMPIQFIDVNYVVISYVNRNNGNGYNNFTFTTPENTKYIRFGCNSNFGTAANMNVFLAHASMQLEVGSVASNYEPYQYIQHKPSISSRNICPNLINFWEPGHYNTGGAKEPYANRIRLKELLPVNKSTTYYLNTYGYKANIKFVIRTYDINGVFRRSIGAVDNNTTITTLSLEYYLGVSIYDSGGTTISWDKYNEYFATGQIKPYICLSTEPVDFIPYGPVWEDISGNNNNIGLYNMGTVVNNSINVFDKSSIVSGFINATTGAIETSDTYPNSKYAATSILVNPGQTVKMSGTYTNPFRYRIFDTTGGYIGSNDGSMTTYSTYKNSRVTPVYVYILFYQGITTEQADTIQAEYGTVATSFVPYSTVIKDITSDSKNIVNGSSSFSKWGNGTYTVVNPNTVTLTSSTVGSGLGIQFSKALYQPNTDYVLSFIIKATGGSLTTIGGHRGTNTDCCVQRFFRIDGTEYTNNWNAPPTIAALNDGKEHFVEFGFTTANTITDYIYIQPNRNASPAYGLFACTISQLMIEASSDTTIYEPYYAASGWTSKSLMFDGMNDYGFLPDFNQTFSTYTIEVYRKKKSQSKATALSMYQNNIASNGKYSTLVDYNSSTLKTRCYYANSSNYVEAPDIISNDDYVLLSFVVKPTSLELYQDGELVATQNQSVTMPISQSVWLSYYLDELGTYYAQSEINAVRIYNRALTQDEIRRNYTYDKHRYY